MKPFNHLTIFKHLFWQDLLNRIFLEIGFILNLCFWVFLLWNLEPTTELIPLHYNIYLGIDLIKPWWHVYQLPLIGLIIFLTNFILAFIIFKHNRLLAYFLLLASLVIQCVLFWAGILIVNL